MADIRIKDLATLESASLTGDVFVIDGTTGTRKLSAFSPSFGGNATVTGTLTVNGTTASVGAGTGSIISKLNGAAGSYKLSIYQSAGVDRWYAGLAAGAESGSDGGAPYSIVALTDAGAVIDNALLITRAAGGSITTPRPVSISATTASTTTSTGALVVSGGLGVAGAIYAGGNIVNTGVLSATSSATTLTNVLSNTLTAATNVLNLQLRRGDSANGFSRLMWNTGSTTEWSFGSRAGDTNLYVWDEVANAERLKIASSTGNVSIAATTASTSTSSGALVVSGGVGVAKRIHSGEGLTTGGDNETHISFVRNGTVSIGPDSTGTPALVVSSAIKTSAPSGGTAANWKLGTVATVSPTSPNRTIEVDIGGTIYYIHAKTTNN